MPSLTAKERIEAVVTRLRMRGWSATECATLRPMLTENNISYWENSFSDGPAAQAAAEIRATLGDTPNE